MNRNLRNVAVLSFWLLTIALLAGCARPILPDPPPVVQTPELEFPDQKMTRFEMSNGLEVLIVERHDVPLVTILAAVRTGAVSENPEFDGLSHLYEHMFFKGNAVLPDQERYMARTRELGMSFNAYTSTEAVQYFFTLPRENVKAGLVFMRDALVSPLFDQTELENEINTVLAEYDRAESSPYFYLRQAMTQALFPAYTSRKNVIGERAVIASATRGKMQELQRRYYVPNNTLLVVVGDVEPDDIRGVIEAEFLAWPRAEDPYREEPVPAHPPLEADQTIVVERPFGNILLSFSWHGPSAGKGKELRATYAADVFTGILGQRAGRFQRELVDSGLLQYASFSYHTQRHVGPIHLVGLTHPDQTRAALAAMEAQIEAFSHDDYFTDDELETAKLNLMVDSIYEWQRGLKVAQNMGFWWCVADLDYHLTYLDNIRLVGREDIRRFVAEFVATRPRVTAVLVSPENRAALPESLLSAARLDVSAEPATEGGAE